jgi:hypothetical protein
MPLPSLKDVEASLNERERARYVPMKRGLLWGAALSGPVTLGVVEAFRRAGEALLAWPIADPAMHAIVQRVGTKLATPGWLITASVLLGLGYIGTLIVPPMEGRAAMNLAARTRDFHARPLSPRVAFWRGLAAGLTKANSILNAGPGLLVLGYSGKMAFDVVRNRLGRKPSPPTPQGPG